MQLAAAGKKETGIVDHDRTLAVSRSGVAR